MSKIKSSRMSRSRKRRSQMVEKTISKFILRSSLKRKWSHLRRRWRGRQMKWRGGKIFRRIWLLKWRELIVIMMRYVGLFWKRRGSRWKTWMLIIYLDIIRKWCSRPKRVERRWQPQLRQICRPPSSSKLCWRRSSSTYLSLCLCCRILGRRVVAAELW